MPKASKEYCLKTPITKMGFTQKSSCKAQGFITRTSKQNKGKYIKSDKYKMSKGTSLYSSGNKNPKAKTGYGNAEKAKMTIRNIKPYNKAYRVSVINTMYNRAKFHKYQTKDMREAMKIFKSWMKKYIE